MTASVVPRLLVRADADERIGAGHLVRSLALAQAWRRRGGSVEAMTTATPQADAFVAAAGIGDVPVPRRWPAAEDLAAVLQWIGRAPREASGSWVVVDGYDFDVEYCSRIRAAGARVLAIDDMAHQARYDADVLLNQNLGAERLAPRYRGCGTLLLGPRFALLRPEFSSPVAPREYADSVSRILVTLGGARWDAPVATIVEAIARSGAGRRVKVVADAAGPLTVAAIGAASRGAVTVDVLSHAPDMAELMAWADLAITGGGSTLWEVLRLGLPALAVVVAENQRDIAAAAAAAGAIDGAVALQDLAVDTLSARIAALDRDRERRTRIGRTGASIVDGRGADRVVDAMTSIRMSMPVAR